MGTSRRARRHGDGTMRASCTDPVLVEAHACRYPPRQAGTQSGSGSAQDGAERGMGERFTTDRTYDALGIPPRRRPVEALIEDA